MLFIHSYRKCYCGLRDMHGATISPSFTSSQLNAMEPLMMTSITLISKVRPRRKKPRKKNQNRDYYAKVTTRFAEKWFKLRVTSVNSNIIKELISLRCSVLNDSLDIFLLKISRSINIAIII